METKRLHGHSFIISLVIYVTLNEIDYKSRCPKKKKKVDVQFISTGATTNIGKLFLY